MTLYERLKEGRNLMLHGNLTPFILITSGGVKFLAGRSLYRLDLLRPVPPLTSAPPRGW